MFLAKGNAKKLLLYINRVLRGSLRDTLSGIFIASVRKICSKEQELHLFLALLLAGVYIKCMLAARPLNHLIDCFI
jgi:hypothetical protein